MSYRGGATQAKPDGDSRPASPVARRMSPIRRIRGLVGAMARSWWGRAGAVLVVIAVTLAIVLPAQDPDAVHVVDIAPAAAKARQTAPYEVWVPTGLGAGWRATHASVDRLSGGRVEVHFDYVAPDGGYVGVVQENTDRAGFVWRSTAGGSALGMQQIAGDAWMRMGDAGNPDQISLVNYRADGVVVVVSGTTTWRLLTRLAASLQPYDG